MTACFIRMGGTVVLLLVVVQAAASPPVQPPVMGSALLDRSVVISRVAFGSCYVPQFERSEIWHTILASNPDIFLFLEGFNGSDVKFKSGCTFGSCVRYCKDASKRIVVNKRYDRYLTFRIRIGF